MRADRLLRLALLLQARGRMTADALAGELEVSVRTVYRDIEALNAAGVPVWAGSGPGGGCRLVDGYRSPLASFPGMRPSPCSPSPPPRRWATSAWVLHWPPPANA